jgi:hypothetical protein
MRVQHFQQAALAAAGGAADDAEFQRGGLSAPADVRAVGLVAAVELDAGQPILARMCASEPLRLPPRQQ